PDPTSRLHALQRYRKKKSDKRLKGKLNLATARTKKYTLELSRQRWKSHCDSFNDKTSLKKVRKTYQSMMGKAKALCTRSNVALRLGVSEETPRNLAVDSFFLQLAAPPAEFIYEPEGEVHNLGENQPFSIGELQAALRSAKCNTAPGHDRISISTLRSLIEKALQEQLDWINIISEEGSIPKKWKTSTVLTIPKPGNRPDNINKLHLISITMQ
ncbi:hypothetical protein IscW_ISCW003769, partial [Ixodes scapularis]